MRTQVSSFSKQTNSIGLRPRPSAFYVIVQTLDSSISCAGIHPSMSCRSTKTMEMTGQQLLPFEDHRAFLASLRALAISAVSYPQRCSGSS